MISLIEPEIALCNDYVRLVGRDLVKRADDAELAGYPFSGMLYATPENWVLLSVPNALVRGAFDAMDEPGIELPPDSERLGRLNAHVSVMRPKEIEQIGGIDRITERGHRFNYQIRPVYTVKPAGWTEMERCWFIRVDSPELEKLRKSYGLSPIPDEGSKPFHITLAVRRKGVLGPNEKAKGPDVPRLSPENLAWERAA